MADMATPTAPQAPVRRGADWLETWTPEDEPPSLRSGSERFYDNVFDVLQNGAEQLITPEQSRKQIAVIEECHRQNPLPTRPQSLEARL